MRSSCGFSIGLMVIGMAVICGQLLESVTASSGLSESALRFASMLSVNMTNEKQVQNAIDNGEPAPSLYISVLRPVRIDSLDENITFFIERYVDDLYFQNIGVLREDNEGLKHLMEFKLNNISLPKSPSPMELKRLKTLTLDHLMRFPDRCGGYVYETERATCIGVWPSCETFPPGIRTSFPFVISCEGLAFHIPVGISDPLVNSHVPIHMKPKKRYRLVNYSGGKVRKYKNFCKNVKE